MSDPTQDQIKGALAVALSYRQRGWNALPSRTHVKAPALAAFAEYWDTPLPDWVYDKWATTNIQVMTGARWGLMVVDCDGGEAHAAFRLIKTRHDFTGPFPTWVARTGGGGWHYWFTLPSHQPCPSGRVWGLWDTDGGSKNEGDWVKHKEVRILGDQSLVVAPPSIHVGTGKEYRWLPMRSPSDFADPMQAPDWLVSLPRITQPLSSRVPWSPATGPAVQTSIRLSGAFPTREEILAAVPDKIALAASWGLRIASWKPSVKGWVSCHAIDREDLAPSAAISETTGVYTDRRDGTRLSFFDLGVALGAYATWEDTRADLVSRYLQSS